MMWDIFLESAWLSGLFIDIGWLCLYVCVFCFVCQYFKQSQPPFVLPCSGWHWRLFPSSQYVCSTVTSYWTHSSLVLCGKWPVNSLHLHFGRRTLQVYSFFRTFPCFNPWFRKAILHVTEFLSLLTLAVSKGVEALWLLWYMWSHQLLLHQPVGSSIRRAEQPLRFTLSPAGFHSFIAIPQTTMGIIIAVSRTQHLTGFPHRELCCS